MSAIWQRLSPTTQKAVLKGESGTSRPEQLKTALALEFTTLIQSGTVFEKPHFAFIGGVEDFEQKSARGLKGVGLLSFNRQFLTRVLDGAIRDRPVASATPSQIQVWISRYRNGGLDDVLTNRHSRPRGELASLDLMLWLIAGIESGRVKVADDVIPWLRRRSRGCRLKSSTAERRLRNWRRLRSLPPAERMRTFLVNGGFIHRFATLRHEKVVGALEHLR